MPFIMDSQDGSNAFDEGFDDMTDLFDDAGSVIAPPVLPSTPQLSLKADDLAITGCRQKLVWANAGTIACISGDGQKLNTYYILRKPNDPGFSLSDPIPVDLPRSGFQLPVRHISVSHDGQFMAVLDSRGGVAVYQTMLTFNKLIPRGLFHFDQQEAPGAIVGLAWLRQNRTLVFCTSCERDGSVWKYNTAPDKPTGVLHPMMNRLAFISASRNGSIRLFFAPAAELQWERATTRLGHFDAGDQLLTHAAFVPFKENSLLLATYDQSRTLCVYEIKVDWQFPYDIQQQQPPAGARIDPTMVITRLKVWHDFSPEGLERQHTYSVELDDLRFLPAPAAAGSGSNPVPAVMALFSISVTSNQLPSASRARETKAVILDLQDDQDRLHSSLDQLASKRNKRTMDQSPRTMASPRSQAADLPGGIVTVSQQLASPIVSFIKSDGSVDFRHQNDLSTPMPTENVDKLSHYHQAGWMFPSGEPRMHLALSPNAMLMVSRGAGDEDLRLHYAERALSDTAQSNAEGMALAFADGMYRQCSTDDIFEIMRRNSQFLNIEQSIDALYNSINWNPECVFDDAKQSKATKLLMNPLVIRAISFQHMLYLSTKQRLIAARVANFMVDIRHLSTSIHSAVSDSVPHDLTRGINMPDSLMGIAHHYRLLCAFLIDSLITSQHSLRATSHDVTLDEVHKHVYETGNPTLPLLLCSSSRTLLIHSGRLLRKISSTTPTWLGRVPETVQASWAVLSQTLNNAPVEMRRFETMMNEISHHAREAYESAGLSEAERGAVEKKYLITGELPETLLPVARRLLTYTINKFIDETGISPMRLYQMDFSRLGLVAPLDARQSADEAMDGILPADARPRRRDAVRKIELSPTLKKARRCTRCFNYMEDTVVDKTTSAWIAKTGHICPCGNRWVLVDL